MERSKSSLRFLHRYLQHLPYDGQCALLPDTFLSLAQRDKARRALQVLLAASTGSGDGCILRFQMLCAIRHFIGKECG
jgi:hypothetical protein